MHRLVHWLLDHHEVEGSSARWRICLMLNRLLKLLGEEASIDDDLYQKIFDNMLQRLKDKVVEIRSQAVTALQRLQDPRDPDCPIIKAFLFHLSCDPSAIVRKTVIRCIGATKLTLPHILRRTKDVDEGVRKAAFKFIADKIHIKSLTIAQREQVLQRGLSDRAEGVKLLVEKDLVVAWLRLSNNNIVELLYALDVASSDGKVASQMVQSLFKNVPYRELLENFKYVDGQKLIPYDKLTAETAVYWKNLATFLLNEGGGALEYLDQVVPELTAYCKYLRHFMIGINKAEDDVAWVFIAKQLIEIIKVFDLADEVGRNNLGSLCKDLLLSPKVHTSFVESLMSIFAVVRTNQDTRIQEVAEIIAELRDPMKVEQGASQKEPNDPMNLEESGQESQCVQLAKVRVKLNVVKNDMDDAIQSRDFLRAQQFKLEMDSLEDDLAKLQEELTEAAAMASRPQFKEPAHVPIVEESPPSSEEGAKLEDPGMVQKCLEMIFQLLQDPKIKILNATLMTLFEELVLPAVRNLEPEIRKSAIKAMAVCGIRSLDLSKRHIVLLFQIANMDQSDVRVAALAMVTDLLIWHGLPAFIAADQTRLDEDTANIETMLASELNDPTMSRLGAVLTQDELNSQGGNSVVTLLTRLLDDPDLEIRTKVAEGMCKLLMVGAITSAKLFQRLILMWYNPLAECDGKLRHILGTFFPLYASMSRANQDSIEEAFLPSLKTLFNAPPTSPLGEIDLEDVGMFFLQLTREDFLQVRGDGQGSCVHDAMAFSLANEILSSPDAYCNKILVKLMVNLQISTSDFVKLRELKQLSQEMLNDIKDKIILRTIERFASTLNDLIGKDPTQHGESEEIPNRDGDEPTGQEVDPMNDISLNSTKASKKRTLFTHAQHTLLASPANLARRGESDQIDSTSSSDVFLTPTEPKRGNSSKKKSEDLIVQEITRVEETTDEEGEEDTIVSGNLSKRRMVAMTKTRGTSPSKSAKGIDSSDENEEDEPQRSPVTSTQVEGKSSARLSTFVGSQIGKKASKIQKSIGSSTEEEEPTDKKIVQDTTKKRGRMASKRSGGKKSAPKSDSSEELASQESLSVGRSSLASTSRESLPRRQSSRIGSQTPKQGERDEETHSQIKRKNPRVYVTKLTVGTPETSRATSKARRAKAAEDLNDEPTRAKTKSARATRSGSRKRV
eukprot:maker-scaffold1210_size55525-snap-gene-0.20 protein:Tk07922 transcript:maker-scaffold1210_size55525-snap-gene-0.20-mRNA-1 annotation:"hypothetical protein CAPTEDRAFT_225765"